MARKHRGILATLTLTILLGSAALVAYQVWGYLPEPSVAARKDLFRWLVLRDLSQESRQTQLALVDRLQAELLGEMGVSVADDVLSDRYRKRLIRNADLLKRLWFTARVDAYCQCARPQRVEFLQRQINTIARWTVIGAELSGEGSSPGATGSEQAQSAASGLFHEIEQWIGEASGPQRARMVQAVRDGLVCWLASEDLRAHSMGTRAELAERIARDLGKGQSHVHQFAIDLDDAQRRQLTTNAQLLMESWLHLQAERYFELPEAQRGEFVDEQIDQVIHWDVSGLISQSSSQRTTAGLETARLVPLLQEWIARAEPDQRRRLEQMMQHVQQRLLWRQLRRLVPQQALHAEDPARG